MVRKKIHLLNIMGSRGGNNNGDQGSSDIHGGHRSQHHHQHLLNLVFKIVLLFAASAVSCFVLYRSAQLLPFVRTPVHNPPALSLNHARKNSSSTANEDLELDKVLKMAAMVDNTVIITTLNEAWARPDSIFDLFLESFKIGNQTLRFLKHLVVVALDQKAYARCLKLHLNCYALSTHGVDFSGQANFMTEDYLKMMWRRIDFLRVVLEMGYNFIFTDADILWFRDPFQHLYLDADFEIACDVYFGNSTDLNNIPNGGFNYVKSNKKTIKFYKFWYESRVTNPGKHDQDVLNKIKYDPFIDTIGLEIKFLDTAYFGGICQPSEDFNLVCTMHANCCAGLDNKIHDLKVILEKWRKYVSLPAEEKASQLSSWGVPQRCMVELVIAAISPHNDAGPPHHFES